MKLFYNRAVNVFTDASVSKIVKDGRKVNIVCPAYIVTIGGGIVEYGSKIISDTTNSYGEIFALYMGIRAMMKYKDSDLFLHVYSDSEISVKGLTKWISNWYYTGKSDYILRNNSGLPVINQEIFIEIIKTLIYNNVHINILNILGHTDKNDVVQMNKFLKYFYKSNDIRPHSIPIEYLQEMAGFNDVVDRMSRDSIFKVIKEDDPFKHPKLNQPPMYWYPKEWQFKKYKSLVNH